MRIPRIFHRVWLGSERLPDEFEQFGRTWRERHPDWEMILWTAANLPKLQNEWAVEKSGLLAAKTNIIRYELLERFGGVYIDTDFECLRNIEPLISDVDCFAALERYVPFESGIFPLVNNAIIGCVPHHRFLEDLVGGIEPRLRACGEVRGAVQQTGPYYFSEVLLYHPEVTIFPDELFYPYQYHERWRRYESFPDAYAVHHWALSHVSEQKTQRPLRDDGATAITVVVTSPEYDDALRLQWVLESLALQTMPDFNVILLNGDESTVGARVARDYSTKLRITTIDSLSVPAENSGQSELLAPRILFLDSNCVPTPDLLERHLSHPNVLLYSYRRLYPVEKVFAFRPPLDFQSLWQHSVPEQRSLRITPTSEGWNNVPGYCFSLPTKVLVKLAGFDVRSGTDGAREFARRLCDLGCPSVPCLSGGRVIHLGY
jgi:hypothetical protein